MVTEQEKLEDTYKEMMLENYPGQEKAMKYLTRKGRQKLNRIENDPEKSGGFGQVSVEVEPGGMDASKPGVLGNMKASNAFESIEGASHSVNGDVDFYIDNAGLTGSRGLIYIVLSSNREMNFDKLIDELYMAADHVLFSGVYTNPEQQAQFGEIEVDENFATLLN